MTTKMLWLVAWVAILLAGSVRVEADQETVQHQGLSPEEQPILLNPDSWNNEAERSRWYHTSAGTQLMPFDWFMALNDERLRAGMYRTGVLPDSSSSEGLAVGFAQTTGNSIPIPQLGLTCSFCHTTEFTYQGKIFRIDGGPSLQYNARFVQHLIGSLSGVLGSPEKFTAFATAVFKRTNQPNTPENQKDLANRLRGFIQRLLDRAGRDQSPLFWGPGRFDALGRGGNLIFSQLSPDNLRPANAPASIPALWGAWEYDRVQWGGSIKHPLARNIAQVIGVNANIFTSPYPPFDPHVDQTDPFRSSVDVAKLKDLEKLARKLNPPRWPEAFPAIDRAKASLGRDLYWGTEKMKGLCAHCHAARSMSQDNGTGQSVKVTMIPQWEIATDPLYLNNFATRRVDTGLLGVGHLTAKDASRLLTDEIMKRAGATDDPEYQNIVNEWSDSREFIARPHVAVWATAPYLHNGSVPNLYELLSPVEKRHDCFYLSPTMEFDPQNVGFAIKECTDSSPRDSIVGFEFKTALPGNGNRGHEFRGEGEQCETNSKKDGVLGCEIAPENRLAIIEYLKTCDLDRLVLKDLPHCRDTEWLSRNIRRQSTAGEP
jgi:hypothetical protein